MVKGKPPITCRSRQSLGCFDDHAIGLENNDVVGRAVAQPKAITWSIAAGPAGENKGILTHRPNLLVDDGTDLR